MVLRYWGMVGVRPDDFAFLVSEARGGMGAEELAEYVRALGWDAHLLRGRFAEVQRHVRLGRPLITLVEAAPGRFHYVVIVGEAGEELVLHDPAETPFQLVSRGELERRWTETGGLTLLILPRPGSGTNVRPGDDATPDRRAGGARDPTADPVAEGSPDRTADGAPGDTAGQLSPGCHARLARALRSAAAGDLEEAGELLGQGECASEPEFLREFAGLRLRQGRAAEAVAPARSAVAGLTDDSHAARTLGTALFVTGEPADALAAWNLAGEPTIDLVRIAGLQRVGHRPAARLLGLRGGDLLTPRAIALARRRLADLPAAAFTRVDYLPTGGGRADVVAGVFERPGLPLAPLTLAATGIRAAIYREISLTAVSPVGAGETWSAAWRWWDNRPAVSFRFAAPAAAGPAGTWSLEAGWEEETSRLSAVAERSVEERRGVAAGLSHWLSPTWRGEARLGYDRWDVAGPRLRVGLTAEVRPFADHFSVAADYDRWTPVGEGRGFGRAAGRIAYRSSAFGPALSLTARAAVRSVEAAGPRTLWPGAGTGIARPDLLRAHPLLEDGVIEGVAFDRNLAAGGVELTRWFDVAGAARVGATLFVDAARSWGNRPIASRVDVGGGIRLGPPGAGPALRIDLARGVSDDEWALSAGWVAGAF